MAFASEICLTAANHVHYEEEGKRRRWVDGEVLYEIILHAQGN